MNKHRIRKFSLFVVAGALLSSFVFSLSSVGAVETEQREAILLSPTSKRYDIKAGETKRDSFKVVNDGTVALNFVVYSRPYSVINENYDPNFDDDAVRADAYKWVQFDDASFSLEPGKTTDVNYTMRVPESTAPGGHYGVLFAETQPVEQQASGTAIVQKKRVGAILYATVDGDITRRGNFLGADVSLFQVKPPLSIRQRVENKGNTDFIVQTKVRVYDLFGGLKYRVDKESAVLPDTTRLINSDWTRPAWIGVYRVEQQAKFLDTTRDTTNYVVLIPIWVYIVAALLLIGRVSYAVVRRTSKK